MDPVGAELGHKGVVREIEGAAHVGLECVRGGKIRRISLANNECGPVGAHRDSLGEIKFAAAQVGRIGEHRVDDERQGLVVRPHGEGDFSFALEHEAAVNELAIVD